MMMEIHNEWSFDKLLTEYDKYGCTATLRGSMRSL